MTETNPETCHACGTKIPPEGVPLPSEQEEQAEDGKLTRAQIESMSQPEINERWPEVAKFLREEER